MIFGDIQANHADLDYKKKNDPEKCSINDRLERTEPSLTQFLESAESSVI